MQFSTREDIEAPIEQVFAELTRYDTLERAAMQRGAEVTRGGPEGGGPGTTWDVRFRFRGRPREVQLEITGYEPPHRLRCDSRSDGLHVAVEVELIALARHRTRMSLTLTPEAETLSARLLLQSLKLARGRVTRKFESRVSEYAREMEDRLKARG